MVMIGVSPTQVPFLSGKLLTFPILVVPVPMPWKILQNQSFTADHELQMPLKLPAAPATVYVQVLQLDPGAAEGVSFTPGLKIETGN